MYSAKRAQAKRAQAKLAQSVQEIEVWSHPHLALPSALLSCRAAVDASASWLQAPDWHTHTFGSLCGSQRLSKHELRNRSATGSGVRPLDACLAHLALLQGLHEHSQYQRSQRDVACSCRAVYEERRTYLLQDVQLFLRLTGDSNLLHTDDAAAIRQGMPPRAS